MSCRVASCVGLLVAVGLLVPQTSPAQRLEVTGFGLIAGPRGTVLYQGARETIGGVWLGLAAEVRVHRVSITASGLRGTLNPVAGTPFDRDAGEEAVLVRFEPRSRVGVEASYTVRAFSSAAGYQRWNMLGLGAWVTAPLGDPALRAYGRASYLPAVSVSGQPSPSVALAAEVGVSASPRRAPLIIRLMYRFERFDFPAQPIARFEQFERIALAVGYQIRR